MTLELKNVMKRLNQETVARWEDYCHTGKSVPHEAVMQWLESWGTVNELDAPKL